VGIEIASPIPKPHCQRVLPAAPQTNC
jgi:hypothetical protein